MGRYLPTVKERRREERLLNDAGWHAEQPVLLSLLQQLRTARDDAEFFSFQARLLRRMKGRQDFIHGQRAERETLRTQLGRLVREDPKPLPAIRELQARITDIEHVEFVQVAHNHLLRILGDELVWRRLGANRGAVTVLGQGAPVAWLSSGVGWTSELRAIHEIWAEDGVLAIAHDATTCMRLGDITCCYPDRVEVREVKASGVADANSVQMRRLTEATELITAGRATFDGVPHAVLRAPCTYGTHLPMLASVLARAKRDGRAVARLSHAQLVVAHDLRLPAAEELGPFDHDHAREAAGWGAEDIIIHFGTSLRRMRDRHHNFPYLAPLSLLPLPPEDVVDILLGSLDFMTWVNVSAVSRYLAGRGWEAVAHDMPEASDAFLTIRERRGSIENYVRLAPHLREMMSIELMTTPTLVSFIEHLFSELDRDKTLVDCRPMVSAADESAAWGL